MATVAVVGPGGLVGNEIIEVLEAREFPVERLKLLGSLKSAGTRTDRGTIELLGPDAFADIDLAFFAAGPAVAGEFVPIAVAAGALVLEASEAAAARGVKPLGFLSGTGSAFGPSDVGPGPSAEAIERAARAALATAGASPEDVGLLLVEGGSAEEADARRALFGRRADLAVLAPALGVGHLLAGAPAVAVALATGVLALGRAPSGAGGRPRPVPRGARALVLCSGSAGGAAALVVEGAS